MGYIYYECSSCENEDHVLKEDQLDFVCVMVEQHMNRMMILIFLAIQTKCL